MNRTKLLNQAKDLRVNSKQSPQPKTLITYSCNLNNMLDISSPPSLLYFHLQFTHTDTSFTHTYTLPLT